jgi:hypothetical protein
MPTNNSNSVLKRKLKKVTAKEAINSSISFFDVTGSKTFMSSESIREQNLVLTPGGYRSRSLVHQIEGGTFLKMGKTKIKATNAFTGISTDLRAFRAKDETTLFFAGGWVTYASWYVENGNLLQRFEATWIVPPEPNDRNNQTIFLFNGVQNSGVIYKILQPVLQWGVAYDQQGGPYWSIASWYVSSSDTAEHTPLIRVNPGDRLKGIITFTGMKGSDFTYTCEFENYPDTLLSIQDDRELLWCCLAMEAYNANSCAEYPATDRTPFTNIQIQTRHSNNIIWDAVNNITDCNQRCSVVGTDEVDLYYR